MPQSKLTLITLAFFFASISRNAQSCNQFEQDSLLSFYHNISINSSPPPLNWSPSTNCCQWQGISCTTHGGVTHLWLPERHLSGAINPSLLTNLPFLTHINLSHNQFSGPFPFQHLHSSIQTLDLSSNHFNSTIKDPSFLQQASNLVTLNISNNSFTGSIPSSICKVSKLVQILDFSMNEFSGEIPPGLGECPNLRILRAGFNSLSGPLPYDLSNATTLNQISLSNNQLYGSINTAIVNLSNLLILELHVNRFSGEIPSHIGYLSNLEQLQLHSNNLNGTLPPSLTDCSNLTTLLLRNNLFGGDISSLDFSKLQRLQALDFGNNSFVGNIPHTLCLCTSLTALRLAYNHLVGEVPPCMASLTSLTHLSLSDNSLSNVAGALKILTHCQNLAVLFLSRCFHDERMPDDNDLLHLNTFKNLQILTLGGCKLNGQIPSWIQKLKKLKVLNLSYNRISGPIPTWLGSMPSLFVLNLTQNWLSGEVPREIGGLPALISDNSSTDLSHLALPFLFDSLQYNRLFNLPRGLKLGNNSLSGGIPVEIGKLKLLHILDLNDNRFAGSIPDQLSSLTNLERLDMSGNHLSGGIPESLTKLHFLSAFSVAGNDLEGEIPRGGQFETFSSASFEGNPKLCGYVLNRSCEAVRTAEMGPPEEAAAESFWYGIPFGLGYFVGVVAVSLTLLFKSW